jgi:hypothetical protein
MRSTNYDLLLNRHFEIKDWILYYLLVLKVKSKAIPHTISRQPTHECAKNVSPTHSPPLLPGDIPNNHICNRLSQPEGYSAAGRIKSMKKPITPSRIEPALAQFLKPLLVCVCVCVLNLPIVIITHLSSLVFLHVLISWNLSVLSSTEVISYTTVYHNYCLYYITRMLKITDFFIYGCVVENLCTASLSVN